MHFHFFAIFLFFAETKMKANISCSLEMRDESREKVKQPMRSTFFVYNKSLAMSACIMCTTKLCGDHCAHRNENDDAKP